MINRLPAILAQRDAGVYALLGVGAAIGLLAWLAHRALPEKLKGAGAVLLVVVVAGLQLALIV